MERQEAREEDVDERNTKGEVATVTEFDGENIQPLMKSSRRTAANRRAMMTKLS